MKGILFKEALFEAVVEGKKTQTRRLVGVNEEDGLFVKLKNDPLLVRGDLNNPIRKHGLYACFEESSFKSRYQPNDIVFLKEPYFLKNDYVIFKYNAFTNRELKWKNKLFMPAKYARYFIRITNVRIERLHDITDNDAKAEGFDTKCEASWSGISDNLSYRNGFFNKWIDINGLKSLQDNPWVWVYEFACDPNLRGYEENTF